MSPHEAQLPLLATSPTSTRSNCGSSPPTTTDSDILETNPDMIALKSALSLLESQRQRAQDDIRQLQRLKSEAVESPMAFKTSLMQRESIEGAPKMQHIVRAPTIDWQRDYGVREDTGLNRQPTGGDDKAMFGRVRLFGDPAMSGRK